MALSSIHIQAGNAGYLFHNDRTKSTVNSIFSDEKNEYSRNALVALEIYRIELQKRSKAYTKKTNQNLQKKVQTHLSAIVNLNQNHTLEDVKKVANYLEKTLDTKVFQVAIHRDEGHIDDDGKQIKNYHAHLEFLGIDSNGKSIRRKLTKSYLINLQSKTAELLNMQRGKNYTKEKAKRPKRLDTYEFKAVKQAEAKRVLAKLKDLKEQNKSLRAMLQDAGATRSQYAQLEALNRQLKEQIKSKDLTLDDLQHKMQEMQDKLLTKEINEMPFIKAFNDPAPAPANAKQEDTNKIEELERENEELKQKNKKLEEELEAERKARAEAEAKVEQLKEQANYLLTQLDNLKKSLKKAKNESQNKKKRRGIAP